MKKSSMATVVSRQSEGLQRNTSYANQRATNELASLHDSDSQPHQNALLSPEELDWDAYLTPEPNTGCWLWVGTTNNDGYGYVHLPRTSRGKRSVLAHRIAWERVNGPIPKGPKVCHRRDQPSCVNPDHLFLGTQRDNLRDMYDKGRARPFGVPYRPGDTWSCPRPGSRPPPGGG